MVNLHAMVARFAERWGPKENEGGASYHLFADDLRELLEAYGRAALGHESLPDTEHEHGQKLE